MRAVGQEEFLEAAAQLEETGMAPEQSNVWPLLGTRTEYMKIHETIKEQQKAGWLSDIGRGYAELFYLLTGEDL